MEKGEIYFDGSNKLHNLIIGISLLINIKGS